MKASSIAAALLLACSPAFAVDVPVPTGDMATVKDPAYLGRYTGSTLLTASSVDFDELALPTGKLVAVAGQRDSSNNQVVAPEKKVQLEGKRVHYVYLLPESASTLAAIRNYQNAAKAKGG